MKIFIYLVLLTGMLVSCKKEKENLPPVGEYIGEFKYTDPDSLDPQVFNYRIKSSTKDSFIIELYSLGHGTIVHKVPDKKLEGWIPSNQINSPYKIITGEWKKVKKKYIITGTFIREISYLVGGQHYTLHGTFEIKSQ